MNRAARNRQLGQIKAASKRLFGDDEGAMRDCYEAVTGARFCRDMEDRQLQALGDYLARATGHNPDRPVSLNRDSSPSLVDRIRAFEAMPPPEGWRLHPLRTRRLWRTACGLDAAVPFEALDHRQQAALHRALCALYTPRPRGRTGAASPRRPASRPAPTGAPARPPEALTRPAPTDAPRANIAAPGRPDAPPLRLVH